MFENLSCAIKNKKLDKRLKTSTTEHFNLLKLSSNDPFLSRDVNVFFAFDLKKKNVFF